jgi:hypothetical protein
MPDLNTKSNVRQLLMAPRSASAYSYAQQNTTAHFHRASNFEAKQKTKFG